MSSVEGINWHKVNSATAEALTTITESPGVVYGLKIVDLPENLQKMRGVTSYYVSGYASPQAMKEGLTVAGAVVVARVDRDIAKNYQFVIAVSSDGATHFAGPFKAFSGHHVTSGQCIPVNSLFGHTPFSTR
jgi:hypothetical protein